MGPSSINSQILTKAQRALRDADALLITAGAGMGVDSGLPDFRGNDGFWKAYPPYQRLGKSFVEMANPQGFSDNPEFAWGFYGQRLNLYRKTPPHDGFRILKEWADQKPNGAFVMTSNVDAHFQRSGFSPDSIYEVHGSIHHLQCTERCPGSGIWSAEKVIPEIDESTMIAVSELPCCEKCGAVARPNILMFGDYRFVNERNSEQEARLQKWLAEIAEKKLVIMEFGAGNAIPTVRLFSEHVAGINPDTILIRVNPREPEIPVSGDHISISSGALDALLVLSGEGS